MQSRFALSDQLVMVDQYTYDLPLQLRAEKPVWVVAEWNDAAPLEDNWRKELADAAKFAPAAATGRLITPEALTRRLCESPRSTVWLLVHERTRVSLAWLNDREPLFTEGATRVWRLTSDDLDALNACRGTPSNG